MLYGQVLLVDAGGYFPETDPAKDVSWFMMDAMKLIGTDAVGVGDRDLRFGISYLRETAKGKKLPLVCANLVSKKTRTAVLDPFIVKKVGNVTVGVFGLISDKVDLGPSRDSLVATDPVTAAQHVVPALRKKGATVIVLLSQLGKVEAEDLVTAVEGIDAVILGHNVPLLQKGRLIKNTVACYGGDQGQYMGRTEIDLGPGRKMASGDNSCIILGPEVGEKPEVAQVVKAFEDSFNEKMRLVEKEEAAKQAAKAMETSPDRYLGMELCARCHVEQAEQWKTTKHAHAWETLVKAKKAATPDCIPCHVAGYKQPGGFLTGTDTPSLVNVQCENCHGMGTKHDSYPKMPMSVKETTCTHCHQGENDPAWSFATKLPKVIH